MNFQLKCCLTLLLVWGLPQDTVAQDQYAQIPAAYRSHPELGKTTHSAVLNQVDYELVHQRTKYSRTFVNTNKTKTTVQSSVPLHYQSADGFWRTIDYKLSQHGGKITYPAQDPFFEFDGEHWAIPIGGQNIKIDGSRFVFTASGESADKAVVKPIHASASKASIQNNEVTFKNVLPGVDKNFTLYEQALKYSYSINNGDFLGQDFENLSVEEIVELPNGFSMREEADRIIVLNDKGQEALAFEQPVISDSKVLDRNLRAQPYQAKYNLVQLTARKYKIQVLVDGAWLHSADRVYPISIDPVVTITNNDIVNSCYLPAYQQAALNVAVPAGETVLASDISYDFVAVDGSGAWMEDQRSFVSGPNGQTPVQLGQGGGSGTMTYNLANSPIANVVSTGQIQFMFNIGRNWGGSGCNATFNFVNRRQVTVTYGTIEFGDGPLVINEYSAANRNFNDGFGRTEDWIELYNSNPDTYFDLTGYYLSNNADNPTKWQIQSGVVPPNSRILVFCSNRDISSGTVMHTNFDLTQTDADDVVLADPGGNIVESHQMFITQTNHSYGRTSDGANSWGIFTAPTPGQINNGGNTAYATKPTFSVAPGKYPGPITVSLTSTGTNEQIRYTTNGATPTAASTLYSGPISVTQNTVVRARAFSTVAGILPGFIETNSYFINDNSSLPVVSLSGDSDLLQLLNGNTLEPTGYFEYFEPDGTFIDETMGDFDRHGNDSWAYNQRGIDFIARDDHGYKRRLQHQFFSSTDRTNFRRLILKAAGSDNYPGQQGAMHFRDVFVQRMSEEAGLELDERRATFVSLFVNGQYWGIYDLREKVDDNQYTDYYYGQDYIFRDSDLYIQYIKTWGATNPEFGNQPAIDAWNSLTAFVQNNDMSEDANFSYVDSQLNVDSLIDYFVLNSYMVNRDWLNWNTSWWRGLDPSGGALKWRYALWDCDGVLGHYINYTGLEDTSANADPCQAENIPVGFGHTQTIGKLIEENASVRQRYVTRYADLLNTHFSCERATQVFDSIVAVIAPEMPRQIQRWGGSMATWQANVQAARNFLLTRCSQTISTGLADCYDVTGPYEAIFEVEPAGTGQIKMNSEWIQSYPFTAQVLGNIETMLKAEPHAGYEFSHWVVDGAMIDPNDTSQDIVLLISQATSVTAHFSQIITGGEQAIHYWHFNTLSTPQDVTTIPADVTLIPGSSPLMTYTGSGPRDIDANNNGSILNLHFDQSAGKCARVRNPSEGRPLLFDLPTTGYKDVKFAYAVQRTNEGQLINSVSYSTDGVNFTQDIIDPHEFLITTDFNMVQIDFSAVEAVNNNPNFKVMVTFKINTTADNGNNRFDNITLKGTLNTLSVPAHQATTYQVFPNPFSHNVQILCSVPMTELSIYDIVGKTVVRKTVGGTTSETVDLEALNTGVYLLKIKTDDGLITHKLIKQ